MNNKIKIKVNIAERIFPVSIDSDKEGMYRKAAKLLNEKLQQYRIAYKNDSDKDILSKMAYVYLVKYLDKHEENKNDLLILQLKDLNEALESSLLEG